MWMIQSEVGHSIFCLGWEIHLVGVLFFLGIFLMLGAKFGDYNVEIGVDI